MTTIVPWIERRILDFLNQAETVDHIVAHPQLAEEEDHGHIIDRTVAAQIIARRDQLKPRRFNAIKELNDIPGMDEDRINKLIAAFGWHATDRFVAQIPEIFLLEDGQIDHRTAYFDDKAAFLNIVGNESNFREYVAHQIRLRHVEREVTAITARYYSELVRRSYIERFNEARYGGIALAFWLYQYTTNATLSFDRIRALCEKYLNTYNTPEDRLELFLFKGFEPVAVGQRTAANQGVLPVVVNHGEQGISLFEAMMQVNSQ